ncbi:unnamed protein product [Brassicogethes aeneus]|uniref:Uncharacterized protein n=1 Tax=Brassicogethes aeneus TaxID=1431903 RepID=A0A9P0BEW1_BRAAE|nr:unnamed protein product [Brassicogethes aeneus]
MIDFDVCTKTDDNDEFFEVECDKPGPLKVQRARKTFITPRLVAALDRCKISDRNSVHILVAVAEAHRVQDLVLNKSSIYRCRQRLRPERAAELKGKVLNLKESEPGILVHWEGKLLPALIGKERVFCLPVIVTCNGTEHLLGVPQLESRKGDEMASAVNQLLEEYQLSESVEALCCDTTP